LAFRGGLAAHRRLGPKGARRAEPALPPDARGAFIFWDARAIAPERLALELVLEARAWAATVLTHARVTAIGAEDGAVTSVTVEAGGVCETVPCRAVVNAAGPWVDAVTRLTGERPPLLGVTKGTHIVLQIDRPLPRSAIFSTARSDGRVFFVVPQDGLLVVGTTDDRYVGPPGDVRPTREECDYLLDEARAVLPGFDFAPEQVRYAYAGLRPLPASDGGAEAAITRRHLVIDHAARGGPRGLLSVIGGKLSTFRPLADTVAGRFAPGRRATWPASPPVVVEGRPGRFGAAAAEVIAYGNDVVCPETRATSGEVRHAIRNEFATTLSDILLRRTGIAWGPSRGSAAADAVAEVAAGELGWDAVERTRQLAAFRAEAEYHLPRPGDLRTAPPTGS
jgi:glycerol-3-phosphate dehydrogenase